MSSVIQKYEHEDISHHWKRIGELGMNVTAQSRRTTRFSILIVSNPNKFLRQYAVVPSINGIVVIFDVLRPQTFLIMSKINAITN